MIPQNNPGLFVDNKKQHYNVTAPYFTHNSVLQPGEKQLRKIRREAFHEIINSDFFIVPTKVHSFCWGELVAKTKDALRFAFSQLGRMDY